MPPKEDQDVTLYAGKDKDLNFTEIDTEDISGFSEITYSFADHKNAAVTFNRTNSGGGITVVGSSNQSAKVRVAGSNTSGLTAPATYYHEVVTDDGTFEQVAATGEVLLLPSIKDN